MLSRLLLRFGGRDRRPQQPGRERIFVDEAPAVVYAIGDVHGCHRLLKDLESRIVEDAAGIEGEKWIVGLGDYIDRGPASAMVIDHLLAPPPHGFRRICLAGNHEQIAHEFLRMGNHNNGWLDFGGREALASYGLYDPSRQAARLGRQIASHIPEEHIAFLSALPVMLSIPGFTFVHAGIDPATTLAEQPEQVLLWSRPREFTWPDAGTGYRVVHGHTPVTAVDLEGPRINIDLGAYASGVLCALKVTRDQKISTILAG